MGITVLPSNAPDELTPICNECGICLCWSITIDEYNVCPAFWNNWICQDCNGGVKFTKKYYDKKINGV